jgi:hypothetical protein
MTQNPSGPSAVGLPRTALYVGIFLTSIALITLEVTLTRVFSVMIWNHLSFMAISIALLGFSLAGLLFFFFPVILRLPTRALLLVGTLGFAGGLFLVGLYIYRSPDISARIGVEYGSQWKAAAVYLIYLFALLVVPFFFSGLIVSAAIVKEARDVGRVYASNLIGSGAACLLVIGSLNVLGAFRTLLLVFALVLLSLVCYAWRRRGWWLTAVIGLPALALAGFTIHKIAVLPASFQVIHPIRLLSKRTDAEGKTLLRRWNSFSCVDFYAKEPYEGFWGLKREVYDGPLPQNLGVLIDSWALTTILNVDEELEHSSAFDYVPSSLPFEIFKHRGESPDVLIIGSGGGIDVLTARHHGADRITAVEINPLIVEGALRKYPELRDLPAKNPAFARWTNRSVYDLPGVDVHVAEGRNFVDRTDRRFDLIMIPGVDTATGTEAGNFSFSENYLYTVDAMTAYLEKLEPGGLVYVLRFKVTEPPSEMLRLTAIAEAALRRQGVRDPRKRILVYHSNVHVFACLVIKNGEDFTEGELARCHEKLEKELKCRILFSPALKPEANDPNINEYLSSEGWKRQEFLADYPYRVHPVTDDEPFFFNFTRFGTIFHPFTEQRKGATHMLYYVGQTVLYYCFLGVLALALLFVVLPLVRFTVSRTPVFGRWRLIAYFLSLGFGYIVIEIVLMQKFVFFLGYPVYAMSVILFSLLTFSGLGSVVSTRIRSGAGMTTLFGLLLAMQAVLIFLFEPITAATFELPLLGRIAVAVSITGPLGFLMGMPFPLGIRYAEAHARPLLPWIWSLNGYASVLGSVMSVILAIQVGFTTVLFVALGVYLAAFLLLASLHRSQGAPST